MKWNEAVFRALGEISAEAVPDAVTGGNGTEDDAEVPRRRARRNRRPVPVLTAAVLLCAGIGLLAALHAEKPAEEAPDGLPTAVAYPVPDSPETEETQAVNPKDPGAGAGAVFRYLTPGPPDDFIPMERVLEMPVPGEPSREPQIFPEEDPESIPLPGSSVFETRDGNAVRAVAYTEVWDDESLPLIRNLLRDLSFANFTRSYGCVLWEADWEREEAWYLGVVPLLGQEEVDARLLSGEYLTSVPTELTPELDAETLTERIGRRTFVYLLIPGSDRIMMYDCIFIRLENEAGWGLYYVPAAVNRTERRLK